MSNKWIINNLYVFLINERINKENCNIGEKLKFFIQNYNFQIKNIFTWDFSFKKKFYITITL